MEATESTASTAPEVVTDPATGLKVVIIGCCHGELDAMYDSILYIQQKENIKIDLVLCCGDFQAVRNITDLNALACPQQHRRINTFYKYYSGEKVAPVTTVFVGGNHEASNHLTELYYGGWVAPNIYFLGMSGVVNFGGLRIGGLSGIFKKFDYRKGHYEMPPYTNDSMRSVYHVREFEVFKLMQLTQRLDVMLSHDWPRGIAYHGDKERLLRAKGFLRQEIESGVFGSPPAEQLLHALQPEYWFSAHMHVKFPALVNHPGGQMTKFLALDKVMPNRDFLQVWEFPQAKGPKELTYDEEWLAIVKSTNHMLSFSRGEVRMPTPTSDPSQRFDYRPTREELEWVRSRLADGGRVPDNFAQTAPTYSPGQRAGGQAGALFESPQRKAYLELLELPDLFLAHASAIPPQQHQQQQHQHQHSRHQPDYRPSPVVVPQPPLPHHQLPPLPHHHQLPFPYHQQQPPAFIVPPTGAGLVLPPPLQTATAQLLFPALGNVSTRNEEEIELSFDDEDGGGDEDGAGGAKRQRVDEPSQPQEKNAEEIELDLDDAAEE